MGQFSVTVVGEECRLTSKGSLDRERKDKHTLKVIATDGKFQTAATVEVHVLDSNDNSPLCEQVSHALLFKKYTNLICDKNTIFFINIKLKCKIETCVLL